MQEETFCQFKQVTQDEKIPKWSCPACNTTIQTTHPPKSRHCTPGNSKPRPQVIPPATVNLDINLHQDCAYRGNLIEERKCKPCQAKGKSAIPVYQCKINKECTLESTGIQPRVQGCTTCTKYTPLDLSQAVKHLTYHIWPVKGNDAWTWNVDQIMNADHLFNGKRIIAIATDKSTYSAEHVKRYLGSFPTDIIEVENDRRLREVATWVPMLELLQPYTSPLDVTFSSHAKGVRYSEKDDKYPIMRRWSDAMYRTLLTSWDKATRPLLERHPTVGSFLRTNVGNEEGWGPWHWTGSFFWWRNKEAFARDWRNVPQAWYGTEAWPGLVFKREEAGVMILDNVIAMDSDSYWKDHVEQEMKQWEQNYARR